MILTPRQLAVLNDVVEDGQAWADNAKQEDHMIAKVAKYADQYDAKVLAGSYKTRQQRDDAYAKAKQDAYDNAAYDVKRQRTYPSIADQLDDIYHNGIDAWKATIKVTKDKFPK